MTNANSTPVTIVPLLEMDEAKLVHIYSAKLSQLTKKQRLVLLKI